MLFWCFMGGAAAHKTPKNLSVFGDVARLEGLRVEQQPRENTEQDHDTHDHGQSRPAFTNQNAHPDHVEG